MLANWSNHMLRRLELELTGPDGEIRHEADGFLMGITWGAASRLTHEHGGERNYRRAIWAIKSSRWINKQTNTLAQATICSQSLSLSCVRRQIEIKKNKKNVSFRSQCARLIQRVSKTLIQKKKLPLISRIRFLSCSKCPSVWRKRVDSTY